MIRCPVDETGRNSVAPSTMPSRIAVSDCIPSALPLLSLQAGRHRDPISAAARTWLVFHRQHEHEVDVAVLGTRAGRRIAVEEAIVTGLLQAAITGERDARPATVQVERNHLDAEVHAGL